MSLFSGSWSVSCRTARTGKLILPDEKTNKNKSVRASFTSRAASGRICVYYPHRDKLKWFIGPGLARALGLRKRCCQESILERYSGGIVMGLLEVLLL